MEPNLGQPGPVELVISLQTYLGTDQDMGVCIHIQIWAPIPCKQALVFEANPGPLDAHPSRVEGYLTTSGRYGEQVLVTQGHELSK